MSKKTMTRRALFTSVISLILCCAMLMGTTFAWFTDSVTSANNLIQSGNLDVELYHSNKNTAEEKVTGTTQLFNDVSPKLWEPGAVAYENLRVENVGTLALKYDLKLTVQNESIVNEHRLSEVIKVGIVDGKINSTDRDEVVSQVTSWVPLNQFNLNKTGEKLEAKTNSGDFSVVLYWQPNSNEIDNQYNMNNGKQGILQLDIGVALYATQVEHEEESDSFGFDYDAGAYIEDDAALKEELTQNKETIIINLTSDVNWDVAAWANNPMGGELTKTIAINGNGHTITFNNTNSDWNNIVTGDAVLVIENATITNSGHDATSGTWNAHDIVFKDEVKLNNVTLLNAIALMDDATLNNVNLTDDSSSDAYGIWIRPNGQTVSINGLTMDMTTSGGNDRGIKIDNEYAEDSDNGVTLSVKNATFKTESKAAILVKSTGTVNITLEDVNISGVAADPINAVWIDEDNADYADKTTVTGGTKIVEGQSTLVADGLYMVGNTYYVTNANGLAHLGTMTLSGNTVELNTSVDMSGKDMTAIQVGSGGTLTFNGNGNTISNLSITSELEYGMTGEGNEVAGLFDVTENSGATLTVNDLALTNVTSSSSGYAAAIVGYANNDTITLNNVDVNGATITAESVAALVAYTSAPVDMTDCDVSNLSLTGEAGRPEKVGAFVGTANTASCAVTTTDCTNSTSYGDYGRVIGGATWNGAVQQTASTQADLTAAVGSGDKVEITLSAGEYTVPTNLTSGQEVTIVGDSDTVINVTNGIVYPSGSAVTMHFEGVTINGSGYTNGLANTTATYTNCTFNTADMYLYRSAKFVNCTFNDTGTYSLWTWGAGTVEFEGCTFNTSGKALYVNANVLDNGTNHQTVKITDCKFFDTGVNDIQKAAIETGDDYNCHSYDIFINETTVEGFAVTEDKTSSFNYGGTNFGTNVWGNKYLMGTDKLNVVIDGVDVH